MATLLQPGEEETLIIPEGFEIVDSPTDENKDDEFNLVLSELGVDSHDDIMLKVYRINDMGVDAQCFDCLPDAINGIEDRLRKAYGAGNYKIKVFCKTSSGGKAVKKVIKLALESPLEPVIEQNNNDDLKTVMAQMMQAQQTAQTNMMAMFKESQLESQNKTQEMLITVLSNKKDDKQPSILETMAALKELTPKTKDPMVVFGDMMRMNREIKDEMMPEQPASEGSMGQLLSGVNSLVELAKVAPGQQTVRPQQADEVPQSNQQENIDMNFLVRQKLKSHLSTLLIKANEGKNPSLWAALTLDEIPDKYYPQLLSALGENDEQGFNNMMNINPDIESEKPWFISFVREIRESFIDDDLTDDIKIAEDGEHINENESCDTSEHQTGVSTTD